MFTNELLRIIEEMEAIITEDGHVLVRVPHLIVHMTPPDRAKVLEWYVQKGDIIQPDALMIKVDFLGDDWYLPVPPLGPLRVVEINALVEAVVHLHDPLIVLAPVQAAA